MSGATPGWGPSASLDVLRKRAMALDSLRQFFRARGVLEVTTPTLIEAPVSDPHLANVRCRLAVRPGVQFFLHTSPEYHMKRLLAAGAPDIFQVCPAYRDGERGPRHLPEFTLVEWYRLGMDFDAIVRETCELVAAVADHLGCPLPAPRRTTYRDLFLEELGIDPLASDLEMLRQGLAPFLGSRLDERLVKGLGHDRPAWLDLAMATVIEPALANRGLVSVERFPAAQAALARLDPADPEYAERFEIYLGGIELANGFHELCDPLQQRQRFEADNARRRSMGLLEIAPDEALLAALASGLPDCSGVALGFERLLMASLGLDRIDSVVSFAVPGPG